jgi:protein required for attachment to host cells
MTSFSAVTNQWADSGFWAKVRSRRGAVVIIAAEPITLRDMRKNLRREIA